METFTNLIALLVALAIIVIGIGYIAAPLSMARSFGLPLPESGPNIPWWLRLKGVRDIVAGLVVLAFMVMARRYDVGVVMLIEALIPLGDMTLVIASRGSRKSALGIHGVTGAIMIGAALQMLSA